MLILVVLAQELVLDLRLYHVTDWNPWVVLLPVIIGLPLWALWTRAKVWAVTKTENQ